MWGISGHLIEIVEISLSLVFPFPFPFPQNQSARMGTFLQVFIFFYFGHKKSPWELTQGPVLLLLSLSASAASSSAL